MTVDPDLRRGFEFGPFSIIPERGIVRRDGEDQHLEPKQMDALVTLARHYPNVVSKDVLVEEVWGGRATADESIVQCIKGIRQALDKDDPRNPKYVETIHGRGYRLMVPLKLPEQAVPEPERLQVPRTWWIAGAIATVAIAVFFATSVNGPPTTEPIDSVVVMQFENLSREENRAGNQWIVDGFSRQLISTLYQEPDLRVLNGGLPGESETPMEIADRYGVNSVISGSVQELDGKVLARVTVYAEDHAKQWGDNFDGTLQGMFDMHKKVADEVRIVITGDRGASTVATPNDSDAYLRFLLGESYLARRDVASLNRAMGIFLESIEIDPQYGPAYLALANTYVLLADYVSPNQMFELAVQTVEQGVARDPSISEAAQTYVGYVQTKRGNWLAATSAFNTAINSTVEYPPAQHYYSRLMAATGRIDDSLTAAISAWEMDQEEQVLNSRLAIAHLWNNDMEEARKYYDIASARNEGAPIHLLSYTLFLIRDGRVGEAREIARRAMIKYEQDVSWVDPVFDGLEELPQKSSLIAALEEYSERGSIDGTALVTLWALAGEADRAMAMAWQLVDDPSFFEIELIFLDEFSILRQHADFPRFLDEIGLTEYWRSEGCRWTDDQVVCNLA
jgi:DNA-binding winged helix-turn-helix (wHTH) protein/TolB-like protein